MSAVNVDSLVLPLSLHAEQVKYLNEAVSGCTQKSTDFEARSKLRVEELAAITKAVEILSSGTVSGAADKYLPSMVQTSFVLRGSSSTTSVRGRRVRCLFLIASAFCLKSFRKCGKVSDIRHSFVHGIIKRSTFQIVSPKI